MPTGTFRTFNSGGKAFIRSSNNGEAKITIFPPITKFTLDINGENAGEYFFDTFNYQGALTSLPDNSFKLNTIRVVSSNFFTSFNQNGLLTTLPDNSFNTNNISNTENNFFFSFNSGGKLQSLPEKSFKFTTITNIPDTSTDVFTRFNFNGELTTLPTNSFNMQGIIDNTTSSSPSFDSFNQNQGKLSKQTSGVYQVPIKNTSSTAKTFYYWDGTNTNEISIPVNDSMYYDSPDPEIPPVGYGDIVIEITTSGVFQLTNQWGSNIIYEVNSETQQTLGSNENVTLNLNVGDIIDIIESIANVTFRTFVEEGMPLIESSNGGKAKLTSILDMNRFTTVEDNTVAGDFFFNNFNNNGALTSLPNSSFNIDGITGFGNGFFKSFNQGGALTTLPLGSFNITNLHITTQTNFMKDFNLGGYIGYNSFNLKQVTLPNHTGNTLIFHYFDDDGAPQIKYVNSGTGFFMVYNSPEEKLHEESIKVEVLTNGVQLLSNQWTTPIGYKVNDGEWKRLPTTYDSASLTLTVGDIISITEEEENVTFRTFKDHVKPLLEGSGLQSKLTYIVPINRFTTDETGYTAGDNFFNSFNYYGTLISLPDGSFNLNNITGAGNNVFASFNRNGNLTDLPDNSFNISNMRSVGNAFFGFFNFEGKLTNLPIGSFDTSAIISIGNYFFNGFNWKGKLTELPVGSFNTLHIEDAKSFFFRDFNNEGKLTKLPVGSFKLDGMHSVAISFFENFNRGGEITTLPAYSFNTENISYFEPFFFKNFNWFGKITRESAGVKQVEIKNITDDDVDFYSWDGTNNQTDTDTIPPSELMTYDSPDPYNPEIEIEIVQSGGFLIHNLWTTDITYMVDGGEIKTIREDYFSDDLTLSAGSVIVVAGGIPDTTFRTFSADHSYPFIKCYYGNGTAKITKMPPMTSFTPTPDGEYVNDHFFAYFNAEGALISLPEGSFDISMIKSVGNLFFWGFNGEGLLTSLPEGSFNTENIISTGRNYFTQFNMYGKLNSLPVNSFKISPELNDPGDDFFMLFNSHGDLTTLPLNSFNIEHITVVKQNFFDQFNYEGHIPYYTDEVVQTKLANNTPDTLVFDYPNAVLGNQQMDITPNNAMYYDSPNKRDDCIILTVRVVGSFTVTNKWTTPILVRGHMIFETVAPGASLDLGHLNANHDIEIIESTINTTFREFNNSNTGLLTSTNGGEAILEYMPPINRFTTDVSGKVAGDNFFHAFNKNGVLNRLPAGSFNIHLIEEVGDNFFSGFNAGGLLTSLPANSFKTDTIHSIGDYFFSDFNNGGGLISLPVGSFRLEFLVTAAGDYFFSNFNQDGALISLPVGSFKLNSIVTTVQNFFFTNFNNRGALTTLPTGSFNISNIVNVGSNFLAGFNNNGKIPMQTTGVVQVLLTNHSGNSVIFYYWDGTNSQTIPVGNGATMYYDSPDPTGG